MEKIKLIQLNSDKVKSIFVGKIKFSVLDKLAKLTYREESDGGKEHFYQRHINEKKVKEISKYVSSGLVNEYGIFRKEKIISIFPTAMILSFNISQYDYDKALVDFKKDGDIFDLIISDDILESKEDRPIFIVDGQYRYMGVKKFYEDFPIIKNVDLEFPITLLVDYDIYEQAKIFAEVNFKQKAVNRSLYYDIFGSLPDEKTDIGLAHFIVKHLNEDNDSPIIGMVKMLGDGIGVVSQAFFVSQLLKLFRDNRVFYPFFEYYKKDEGEYKNLLKILKIYFKEIKGVFNKFWPGDNLSEYRGVLLKTTGIGALIRMLDYIFINGFYNFNESKISERIKNVFSRLNNQENEYFFDSQKGKFSGSGGLQSNLYNELKEKLEYKKVVGFFRLNNKKITVTDIQKINLNGKDYNELSFSDGTKTRWNDLEVEKNLIEK